MEGCNVVIGRLIGEAGLADAFAKPPLIESGRFAALMADAGRDGGPIGLCTIGLSGLKKPDLRLSVAGVDGNRNRLSIVRSDRDGRDTFLGLGVTSSVGVNVSETGLGMK